MFQLCTIILTFMRCTKINSMRADIAYGRYCFSGSRAHTGDELEREAPADSPRAGDASDIRLHPAEDARGFNGDDADDGEQRDTGGSADPEDVVGVIVDRRPGAVEELRGAGNASGRQHQRVLQADSDIALPHLHAPLARGL